MYKIYKYVLDGDVVYVGRTTRSLVKRKANGYKRNPELDSIYKLCDMILIEETDDKSREQYWINYYKSDKLLNKLKGRTKTRAELRKNWAEKNQDKVKEYNKNYKRSEEQKEKQREYMKQYRIANKEKLKVYFKERYDSKKNQSN